MNEESPAYVALAGDWHGNWRWAVTAVQLASAELDRLGESRKIIIQLGDFGFEMPAPPPPYEANARLPLNAVDVALEQHDMELWWLDGNHEDWPGINRLLSERVFDSRPPTDSVPLPCMSRIRYLPRGTRWIWHGRTWLAVGGAVSVDKLLRTEGVNWHPDEEITEAETLRVSADGPADVLLAHDCPAGWLPPLGEPAQAWLPMLARAREHSGRLRDIAEAVCTSHVFHGHYHVTSDRSYPVNRYPGLVRVTSLMMDGYTSNLRVVNLKDLG